MPASETAEAILLVVKRLAKWGLWGVGSVALVVCLFWGGYWLREYVTTRPHPVTQYAGLSLGDSQDEVLYSLGIPTSFLVPPSSETAARAGSESWEAAWLVVQTKKSEPLGAHFREYADWAYSEDGKRIDVKFDKPGGRVSQISCSAERIYACPNIFGISLQSSENEVLAQLGKAPREHLSGMTKTMRFPQFNLTLYLERRQVIGLMISAGAEN